MSPSLCQNKIQLKKTKCDYGKQLEMQLNNTHQDKVKQAI